MRLSNKVKFPIFAFLALVASDSLANQHMIVANDGKTDDHFGFGVDIDGTTVLVGAFKADINGLKDAGAAYVYALGDNGWYQQAKLVADPSFADDTLGGKVVIKNNVAMLGVMRRDDKGQDSGAVVSFERTSGSWKQHKIFTAPDAMPGDAYGQSIALSENILVVGAPRSDALGDDSGAAYIYQRESGQWHFQTKITASDGAAGDLFGISVAIDGDTIVVGADLHDEKAENAGAVYVYKNNNNEWSQEAKLVASDAGKTDIFGVRVAISGDTALISARRDDIDELGVDAGSAYIFERSGSTWTQKMKLISPDGTADDRFGRSVALSGNTAIISAMNHDENGTDAGAVYVYQKGANGWQYTSKIVAENGAPGDQFGWSVALSNGVAVISTPNRDSNGPKSGAVYIQQFVK
ncbi:hypothetical protein [Alteromonas facilis]|uniref:hypothetical protein n=1 Tax=Alteromonas facilis TaxID=2048004 RepID=UPI000C28A46F|nr:hypothetical protein [Alteromonas facilis]